MKFVYVTFFVFINFIFGSTSFAHERWIKHDLQLPVNDNLFLHWNFDLISILARSIIFFIVIAGVWKNRLLILEKSISFFKRKFPSSKFPEESLKFIFDEPLYNQFLFEKVIPYIQRFAVRCPSLVLMYAAAGNFLFMPSFPLETSEYWLKPMQVILAIFILTELMLPIVGWSILIVLIYLTHRFGIVSIDALPLLGLAFIYITMPMFAKRNVLFIRNNQIKILKIIIGLSFLSLGLTKIINYRLLIGALDNHTQLLNDPFIKLFWIGTDPRYQREWWAFGFGMSEILTGLIVALGMFKRFICLLTTVIFIKLMVFSIGWEELPHLFPISIFLLIGFSKIYSPNPDPSPRNRRWTDQYKLKDAKNFREKIVALYVHFLDRIN